MEITEIECKIIRIKAGAILTMLSKKSPTSKVGDELRPS